jgi:hypothetical protein
LRTLTHQNLHVARRIDAGRRWQAVENILSKGHAPVDGHAELHEIDPGDEDSVLTESGSAVKRLLKLRENGRPPTSNTSLTVTAR